jgi:predicted ArsR family transcriptional regulator
MARPTQITDDAVVEALAAGGEVTAAELADQLGMGQSTAAKRLAALEASGGGPAYPRRAGEGRPGRRPLVERHRRARDARR